MQKKIKIYITGVTGFIGSKIAEYCKRSGFHVIGIIRREKIKIKNELGIEILESNLLDVNELILEKADFVIHCATANDIISRDFNSGINLSVVGTKKLLEAAKNANIKNFIFFSTAQVYGAELQGVIDETAPLRCESSYALNHFYGEELCKLYTIKYGFNILVLRPSNVYGVPSVSTINRTSLVPICFVNESIKKKVININSSGRQIRNFVSTEQVANLVLSVLENFPSGFAIINVGSDWCASIKDIAKMVAVSFKSIFGKKISINRLNNNPKTSNHFKYKSIFFSKTANKKKCKENMNYVITELFKKNSSHND
jgi:UDP-glucose 4-epimerase